MSIRGAALALFVASFVASDRLYFMLYLAAVPYYYDKHLREAESIIKSAVLPAP